jgi:hypothetical protein
VPSGNAVFIGGASPFVFQRGVSTINVIQAAAPTGVSGAVNVSTPALDLSGSLAGLEVSPVSGTGPARNICQARGSSSFAQSGRGALPASGRGLLTSTPGKANGTATGTSAAHVALTEPECTQ